MKYVIVLKAKLLPIDNAVPLFIELNSVGVIHDPVFIIPDESEIEMIRANRFLWEAIESIGRIRSLISSSWETTRGARTNRLRRLLRNLFVVREFFLGPVTLYELEDSPVFRKLYRLNKKIFGGKRIILSLSNIPLAVDLTRIEKMKERGKYTRAIIHTCDVILSSHNKTDYRENISISVPDSIPILEIGYTRGMPQWQDYLDAQVGRLAAEGIGEVFAFLPLTVLFRDDGGENVFHFNKMLEGLLDALRPFEDRLQFVFRPHPTTDPDQMAELIEKSNLRNYVVTNLHPMLLLRKAQFMATYAGTTLTSDAHFLGCPVIEFSSRDENYAAFLAGRSLYHEITDYFIEGDEDLCRQVVGDILDGKAKRPDGAMNRDGRYTMKEAEAIKHELAAFV